MLRHQILFILGQMRIGGTERHVATLIRGLDQNLFDPKVLVLGDIAHNWDVLLGKAIIKGLPHKNTNAINGFVSTSKSLRRLLIESRMEIVHSFFYIENLLSISASCGLTCRTVISKRNLMPAGYSFFKRWMARMIFPFCDAALANSLAVRNRSMKYDWIKPDKFSLIHNGLDLNRFQMSSAYDKITARKRFGLKENTFAIGAVANFKPLKGLHLLIDAAISLKNYIPDLSLVLVGDGHEKNALLEQAKKGGISERLNIISHIETAEQILPAFDVAVLPSLSEGFSNSILEYMGCGLPLVVSNVGGNSEIVIDGYDGFIVKPGDAEAIAEKILRLYQHPDLGLNLGKRARAKAETQFSLETMLNKYKEFYLGILEKK